MSSRLPAPLVVLTGKVSRASTPSASPVEAVTRAFADTVRLLFRPLDGRRWLKLTIVCLFLGGGTPTAAFHWTLSTLPVDIRLGSVLGRIRLYLAPNLGFVVLAMVLGLALGLAWLYLRSVFRFVLVDSLVKEEVSLGPAWTALRPLGRSYFFWLLGTLAALAIAFSAAAIAAYPYLQSASAASTPSLISSLIFVAILASVVLVGLLFAVLITLTDDLVVPLMYAERSTLLVTWRSLATKMRADPGPFTVYLLLRFALSVAIGVATLLFLFPILVGVFSGAVIAAALAVLGLRLVGVAWVWSPFTIGLALVALLLLIGVLLILLSMVGMPGQVFLQDFGMRFIVARSPSLEVVWRTSRTPGRRR